MVKLLLVLRIPKVISICAKFAAASFFYKLCIIVRLHGLQKKKHVDIVTACLCPSCNVWFSMIFTCTYDTTHDSLILASGILRLDARARQDVAILGSEFLKLDGKSLLHSCPVSYYSGFLETRFILWMHTCMKLVMLTYNVDTVNFVAQILFILGLRFLTKFT